MRSSQQDFADYVFHLRKWSKEEREEAFRLHGEGIGPKGISEKLQIPFLQVKWWLYPPRKKGKKKASLVEDYHLKYNDWFQWRSASLASSLRRRCKKLNRDDGKIPTKHVLEWIKAAHKVCFYCGAELTMKTFSVDHAQPLSREGANAFWNFRSCCKECNNVKGAMDEEEFLSLQALISTWKDQGKYLRGRLKGAGTLFRR